MPLHPIFRCRRAVLAAIIGEGGEPRPDQWRRAALEPFDEYVTPWGESSAQKPLWPSTQEKPKRLPPGPTF